MVYSSALFILVWFIPLDTAGGVAEETFGSIRTVAALRAENPLMEKFAILVREAEGVCG